MNKPTVEIIEEEKYISQIIDELRKEYGVKRKGDTYMDEEMLRKKYAEYVNGEFELAGVFNGDELMGYVSYKTTDVGLLVKSILVFQNHRGGRVGTYLMKHIEKYAMENGCKQIYFGARRSVNNFYFKLGFTGVCLIQSSKATKEDLENLMKKYNIKDYSYSLYEGCNPPVNQIRINAEYISDQALIDEIDNSDLDIGCILTFSKKLQYDNNLKP